MQYTIQELANAVTKLQEDLVRAFPDDFLKGLKSVEMAKERVKEIKSMLTLQIKYFPGDSVILDAVPELPGVVGTSFMQKITHWADKAKPIVGKNMAAVMIAENQFLQKEKQPVVTEKEKTAEEKLEAKISAVAKELEVEIVELEKEAVTVSLAAQRTPAVEEKKTDARSVLLMSLASQMPGKYDELTHMPNKLLGKIPLLKKVVHSHKKHITQMLEELKKLDGDASQSTFEKQVVCVLKRFGKQNTDYNVKFAKKSKKTPLVSAGHFKPLKKNKRADNLPDELNRKQSDHHYSRMLAVILQMMVKDYKKDLSRETVETIQLLTARVKPQVYFEQQKKSSGLVPTKP